MVHYFPLYLYLRIEREKKTPYASIQFSAGNTVAGEEEERKIVRGKKKASEVDSAMEIT